MALSGNARKVNAVCNSILFVCTFLQGFIWPTYIYIVMLFVHGVVGASQKRAAFKEKGVQETKSPMTVILWLLDTIKSFLFFTARHRNWFVTDMIYFLLNLVMFHAHFLQTSPSMTIALTRQGYPVAPTHTSVVSGKDTKKVMENWVGDDNIKVMFVEWPNDGSKEYNLQPYTDAFTATSDKGVQRNIRCERKEENIVRNFSCFQRAIEFEPTDERDVRKDNRIFPMPSEKYKIELKVPSKKQDNDGCATFRVYRAVNTPRINFVKNVTSDAFGPVESALITDHYKNFDYITAIGSNHSGALAPNLGTHHCMEDVEDSRVHNGICTCTTKMYEAKWYWNQFETFCEKQSSWIQVPDRMDTFRKLGSSVVSEEIVVEDIFIVKGDLDHLVARFSEIGGEREVSEYFFGALWKQIPGKAPWDLKETWLLYTIFFLPVTMQMARAILRSGEAEETPRKFKMGDNDTTAAILLFFYGPALVLFISLGSWLCVAAIILMMWNNQEHLWSNEASKTKPSPKGRMMKLMNLIAIILVIVHTVSLMAILWPTDVDTQWLLNYSPYMSDHIASNNMYKAILSTSMAPSWMSLMAMPSVVVCLGLLVCWLFDAYVLSLSNARG